ncbi:rsbT co-antagonist protein RsbR [Salsuginibacillus halophilus]|uniref:RsbT co-antagonist protein RsbR n=1 Tax=Salsuginibacillus halophilus TaxID=517424 RepID=A0A2P8H8F2_9BACI|nr:STAS domain-containing protein [Salsuginibacillus halophilus]PSL42460.1 rsbT co-antagonist protein RsbR [Salsuginibacillus halophilus]
MEPSIIDFIYKRKQLLVEKWLEEVESVTQDSAITRIPEDIYSETNREFIDVIVNTLHVSPEEAKERLRSFVERLIHIGWPLSYFTRGLQAFRRVILEEMKENTQAEQAFSTFGEVENWIDGIVNQLVDEYTGSWENTLNLQKLALKELSAPLIPVFSHISVMPLIGTIDTERAKLIMENLLEGIIEHRSQVVLIDITGVPVVDTMVAHHIIQAAEAVRLVGAECILVGIRPEIAQTIVNLGIDLGKFPTKSTLRKGIESGLEVTNKKIVEIE